MGTDPLLLERGLFPLGDRLSRQRNRIHKAEEKDE